MALLTVTKGTFAEAGNSVLTASVFQGLARNFGLCACVVQVFYAYTASAEILHLPCKQRMVIGSAELSRAMILGTGELRPQTMI